jgi:hypothetical protein
MLRSCIAQRMYGQEQGSMTIPEETAPDSLLSKKGEKSVLL